MKSLREILLKQHRSVEPKLDRMWNETLEPELRGEPVREQRNVIMAVGLKLWRELIFPSRRVWAGLACAWVLLIAWNLASSDTTQRVASRTEPPTGMEFQALIEQRQMLAQLIEPMSEPPGKRKPSLPGPRSDRPIGVLPA